MMLDEAQWFVHESVAEMLRLGRRRQRPRRARHPGDRVAPGASGRGGLDQRGRLRLVSRVARGGSRIRPRHPGGLRRDGPVAPAWGGGRPLGEGEFGPLAPYRLGCPVRVPEPRGFRPLRSPRRSKARPSPKRRRPGTRTANPPNRERTPGGPRTCWPRLCVTSTERGRTSRCGSPSPISVGSSTRPARRCEPLEGSSVVPARSSEPGEMSWDRVGGSTLRESPQSKSAPSRTLACPVRAQHNALRLRAARFPRWKPPQSRFQHRQRRRGP